MVFRNVAGAGATMRRTGAAVGSASARSNRPASNGSVLPSNGSSRHLCAAMQPARCGQVEPVGIAAQFQHDGGERGQSCRLFGDPQGIGGFRRLGVKQVSRRNAETGLKSACIRKAGLTKDLGGTDP